MIITVVQVKNKIPQKSYAWIWVGLAVASLFRFLYQLIQGYADAGSMTTANLVLNVLLDLLTYALIPTWLCYCCASIFYNFGLRRGVRSVSRNDFIYLTMLFTMAARVVCGFVEIFAMLDETVYAYTSVLLDVTVLSGALYVMYVAVLAPKFMTARDAYEGFSTHSLAYLLCQAVHTGVPCITYFFMASGAKLNEAYSEMFDQLVANFEVSKDALIACYVALGIYAAYVAAAAVIAYILKKKAAAEAPPEDIDPFGGADERQAENDGKVFEEFDI